MRALRSTPVALAALLAGLMAGEPAHAASPDPSALTTPAETPTPQPEAGTKSPAPAPAPADAKPDGDGPVVGTPANPVSDYKPPEPTPEAPPAPAAAAAAPPVVEPLPTAVAARLADPASLLTRFGTREREALKSFYEARADKPVWIVDGAWTPEARAIASRLGAAGEDGLDPRAYPVPPLADHPDDKAVAEADLRLSAAAILYARDARGGRVNPASISRLITPTLELPPADAVLTKLSGAGPKAGEVLQAYNPATKGYLALKAQLAALKAARSGRAPLTLPPGPTLKLGMHDRRVPALRTHFGLEATSDPTAYDAPVADAVGQFQRERGLPGDGSLNVRTAMALADSGRATKPGEEAEILVNMERWRWLPSDLGTDYVLVNVPEFRLRIVRGGTVRDEARVIVGKPESPTPIFSGQMEYAVVNPSWYVPPSLLKTMVPKLASYGGKTWGGYEIVRRGGHISLRQPPGEKNALGFIKFMFPNQHSVYLHDTPNRSLFSASTRAFSHGCVRVDDPFRFADAVLPDWSEERLKRLIGKGEKTLRLPQKLPVHIAYFTASVDEGGTLRRLPDLYGYDAPIRAALGLPGGGGPAIARLPKEPSRKVAERPEPRAARPIRAAAHPRPVATRPTRTYGADPYGLGRSARAGERPEYGEPGLWTPEPAPASRSFW
jgi:murein L,D-transpeptidase YcbB/YkuD